MIYRRVIRLSSAALLAALVLGCGEDDLPTDPEPSLEVTPLFTGIIEGTTVQLTATLNGTVVPVTWVSSHPNRASVSPGGLVTGLDPCVGAPVTTPACSSNLVSITATLTSDPTQMRSSSVTVTAPTLLTSGVPVTGVAGTGPRGSSRLWKIIVPAGADNLRVTLTGGTGDADLFINHGTPPRVVGTLQANPPPTVANASHSSEAGANAELISVNSPTPGTWFVMLYLWDPYAGATLTATVTP